MLIYLDNCCFNRPFDDQKQVKIRIETEAKLFIQGQILDEKYSLAWSYILDYENEANPFPERKETIANWKNRATIDTALPRQRRGNKRVVRNSQPADYTTDKT